MLGYNKMTGYNVARYNADGTEIAVSDSMTVSDNTLAKYMQKRAAESVFIGDNAATKNLSERVLSDEIRLADWLSINKKRSNTWGD